MRRGNSAYSSTSSGSNFTSTTRSSSSTAATNYEDYSRYLQYTDTQYYPETTPSIPGSSFEAQTTYSPSAPLKTHPTPKSLGWAHRLDIWKRYKFVVTDKKISHLVLLDEYQPSESTPAKVYLEPPKHSNPRDSYQCQVPGCNGKQKAFRRPADLDRHYIQIHASASERESFYCSYKKCQRAVEPFHRKDHYRDHFREFHKEDIPGRKHKDSAARQRWNAERKNESGWWRCTKCLEKVQVARDGYTCKGCNIPCETDRVESRQQMFGGVDVMAQPNDMTGSRQYYHPQYTCQECQDTKYVVASDGFMNECPVCRPAPYLSLNDQGSSSWEYERMPDYPSYSYYNFPGQS